MTNRVRLVTLWLSCAGLVLGGGACAGSVASSAPGSGSGGDGRDAGSGGLSAGSGGRFFGSGGGGVVAGSGGAFGSGGAATGAGGAGGVAAGGCLVTITAVSPPSFDNLESGPDRRLRIKGVVVRPGGRAPTWTWTVVHRNDLAPIVITPIEDPSTIEFPIKSSGMYDISAEVETGVVCRGATEHLVVTAPCPACFLFRVIPPLTAGLAIPPQEQRIDVSVANPPAINLTAGSKVSLAPQDADGRFISAYVRVTGLSSGVTVIEGNTGRGPVDVFMLPPQTYDVLVVPDGELAPKMFSMTSVLVNPPLPIERGTSVTGVVLNSNGTPVVGARVVLRSGVRPSTIGVSDATGHFSLWTQTGTLSAAIVPPAAAGLPEARVAATPTTGIALPTNSADPELRMVWTAVARGPMSVVARSSDGAAPAAGAWVRIESEIEQSVGTLVAGAGAAATTLATVGSVRLDVNADDTGLARFPNLPIGRYKVTVVPRISMSGTALTTTPVTLTAAGFAGTINLSTKVALGGTVRSGAAGSIAGVRIIASDQSTGIVAEDASAVAGDRGAYTLSVAPSRSYRLVADPPAASGLARTVLGTVTVDTGDTIAPDFVVAPAVQFAGTVRSAGRAIGGASVQVFCPTVSPACLDPNSPVAEAVTLNDGSFRVLLPGPR
jgi:hypothetical protein